MEVRPIDGNALIEWFSPYLHADEPIQADVVIEDIRSMPTLTPPNEALTLEELREMKGQPVWTVTTGIKGSGRWELVCDVDYADVLEMASCVDGFYDIEVGTYGSTWAAYRLRELAQADREGRCVVLPCKIGDTVYHIAKCRDFSKVLDGTLYDSNGGYGTATGYYCPCELADNCPFDDDSFDCDANKNKPNIFEDTVESVNIDDYEQYLRLDYSGAVSLEDFGKTVFLTREEAEAALEGMKDAD